MYTFVCLIDSLILRKCSKHVCECAKNYAFGDPKILSAPKKDVVSFPLNYSDLLWPSIEKRGPIKTTAKCTVTNDILNSTVRKVGQKFRRCFCLHFFQANWAKNFDLLRVIAVHGTMTIKFYVEF